MSINIRADRMHHAELFGKPVLFTNWLIQRDTVPQGWHCYDLQGARQSPNAKITLVDKTARHHAGTVLSPTPLKREETASRRISGAFRLLGEEMTLEQFCEEHDLACPQVNQEFELRPASPDEAGLFYSELEPEKDEALGTVGHVRLDFGHGGKEFWHTWWPHNGDQFNTAEFKAELQAMVDALRAAGPLKNLKTMDAYCRQHGGSITDDSRSYGYITETEHYRFCLRCTPVMDDYQGYLYCYDLRQQELAQYNRRPLVSRVTYASGEQVEYTDAEAYLQYIREELPDHPATGFRYETLTDDPAVRKQADNILYDLYGEENPRPLEDYENAPEEGMTMGGLS